MTTPDTDLDALAELLDLAEAAPWVAEYDAVDSMWLVHNNAMDIAKVYEKDDALLFCGARNQLPALLPDFIEARAKLERDHIELRDKRNDLLDIRGALSPSGQTRRVPMELGATVAPAIEWLLNDRDRLTAELEQAKADAARIDKAAAAVIRKLGQIHERAERERDTARSELAAAYAVLKAVDEHVTGMWSEIGDHQDHDYDVTDHDETRQAGHTAGRDAEHERITYDLRALLDNDAVRIATGVTCQPGQPWSCGDAHTAGHCVRTADTSAAAPLRAELRRADREHLVDVPYRHMDNLRVWLERPNGSHIIGRVTLEAVEGGGVLVRTRPYASPAAGPKPDDRCQRFDPRTGTRCVLSPGHTHSGDNFSATLPDGVESARNIPGATDPCRCQPGDGEPWHLTGYTLLCSNKPAGAGRGQQITATTEPCCTGHGDEPCASDSDLIPPYCCGDCPDSENAK